MLDHKTKLIVRSVSITSKDRLDALKTYTSLPLGAILDDDKKAIWVAYKDDGYDLTTARSQGDKQP